MGRTGWRRRRLPGGLAWLYIGANRRKKESLSGIRHFSLPIYQSLPFPFPRFHTTSGLTLSLFFSFSTLFLLPVQALYVLSAFILFFHSFHSSLSLLCTFFPLQPLCVCFNHLLIAPSFQDRAWREICASAVEIMPPYQESGCQTQTLAQLAREMAPH